MVVMALKAALNWFDVEKKQKNKIVTTRQKKFFLSLTFGKNKVRSCSIHMQAPLKSFLSSCFLDRCDSIIGGKYMIKHIMFEEMCFLSFTRPPG